MRVKVKEEKEILNDEFDQRKWPLEMSKMKSNEILISSSRWCLFLGRPQTIADTNTIPIHSTMGYMAFDNVHSHHSQALKLNVSDGRAQHKKRRKLQKKKKQSLVDVEMWLIYFSFVSADSTLHYIY